MNRVLQDPGYNQLKDHLIESTGLAFYTDRDEPLTKLVAERLAVLGLRNCSSYAEFLAYGETGCAEMDILIAQLTIGETYFFRDEEQFAAIRDVILPDILARKRSLEAVANLERRLRHGSRALLSGDLAGAGAGRSDCGWQINIHATDLNRAFLIQAAEGKFRARGLALHFRRGEARMLRRRRARLGPFTRGTNEWISFHQMNLMESDFSTSFPAGTHFDLILCRNVMIYFSREVNSRLIGQFHQSLGDGGWLVVGAAESNLDNLKIFRGVKCRRGQAVSKNATSATARRKQRRRKWVWNHARTSDTGRTSAASGRRSGRSASSSSGRSGWSAPARRSRRLAGRGRVWETIAVSERTECRGPFLSRADFRKAGDRWTSRSYLCGTPSTWIGILRWRTIISAWL